MLNFELICTIHSCSCGWQTKKKLCWIKNCRTIIFLLLSLLWSEYHSIPQLSFHWFLVSSLPLPAGFQIDLFPVSSFMKFHYCQLLGSAILTYGERVTLSLVSAFRRKFPGVQKHPPQPYARYVGQTISRWICVADEMQLLAGNLRQTHHRGNLPWSKMLATAGCCNNVRGSIISGMQLFQALKPDNVGERWKQICVRCTLVGFWELLLRGYFDVWVGVCVCFGRLLQWSLFTTKRKQHRSVVFFHQDIVFKINLSLRL